MPLNCCSNGGAVVSAAVLALLLLPVQYLPELGAPGDAPPALRPPGDAPPALRLSSAPAPSPDFWYELWLQFSSIDLIITAALVLAGIFIYLSEWIQRKLLERRITKLNAYLCASFARLRAWDAQQERLERTLRLARAATAEYNLLLFLLLRRRPRSAPGAGPGAGSGALHYDKELADLRVC